MTNKEKLFSAIYKECGELKELSFGCVFLWKEEMDDEQEYLAIFENWMSKDVSVRCLMHLGQQGEVTVDHITKIIGHPIELSHILRTAEAKGRVLVLYSDGSICTPANCHDTSKPDFDPDIWFNCVCKLELTKSISDQSEEVINKLSEIIC